jgi:hypothetical protein
MQPDDSCCCCVLIDNFVCISFADFYLCEVGLFCLWFGPSIVFYLIEAGG